MTIEFLTFVVTLFALLVAGLGSFVSESKRWKRGLAVVTGVIGLMASTYPNRGAADAACTRGQAA